MVRSVGAGRSGAWAHLRSAYGVRLMQRPGRRDRRAGHDMTPPDPSATAVRAGTVVGRRARLLAALASASVIAAALVWLLPSRAAGPPSATHAVASHHHRRGRDHRFAGSPQGRPVTVLVNAGRPGPPVPRDFLGLSFEMADLSRVATYAHQGDLVALMRSLGPGVMRFGGISADTNTGWSTGQAAPAPWNTRPVGPQIMSGLGELARATGWRVILTVDLGHYDPGSAAQEARSAQAALGPRLIGVSIGNEPDAYVRQHIRPASWDFASYRVQATAYRRAIAAAAPGVAFVGPDASSGVSPLSWVRDAARAARPTLLSDHFYPSSRCGYTPTAADLTSPRTRQAETDMFTRLSMISRESRLPLRLDETNNISCRGQPGVSNTFVSALWGVDYVARAMAAGLPGINFHDLIGEPPTYSPLVGSGRAALAQGQLYAHPEWYALLMAHELLGDRPARASVAQSHPGLIAHALLAPDGRVHVVLINYDPPGADPLRVTLRAGGHLRSGSVLSLRAPSLRAVTGVSLGGRSVGSDGSWNPPAHLPAVYGGLRSLSLALAPGTAALVTLKP